VHPTELFTPHFVEQVWKEKGGKHKQLIEPAHVHLDNLKTLADFTQQLYLGMPSFSAWREQIWKKKRERHLKAQAKGKTTTVSLHQRPSGATV
jgi:hypothetical protein